MSSLLATGVEAAPGLAGVLAHQGGWDELGLVLAPLVIVAGLLVLANHRAKRLLGEQRRPEADGDATGAAPQPAEGRPTEH